MSLNPKFWCYITGRIESLWRHSSLSLAAGITVRILLQNFFVCWSLSMSWTYKLFDTALLHLSPQHTTSVTFIFSCQQATINQHTLAFESCDWIYKYQFLSVQPKPVLPQEPVVRSTSAYLTSTITLRIQQQTTSQVTADGRNDFHFPCSFLTPKRITFLCSKCIKFQHGWTQDINDITVPSCYACNA